MKVLKDQISGIILAAGHGKRTGSFKRKAYNMIADNYMIARSIDILKKSGINNINVVINSNMSSKKYSKEYKYIYDNVDNIFLQKNINGTAGALGTVSGLSKKKVMVEYSEFSILKKSSFIKKYLLVILADMPLLSPDTLKDFISDFDPKKNKLSLIAIDKEKPKGYGRLIFENGKIAKIVEEKDADKKIKDIKFCNSGVIFGEFKFIFFLLSMLDNDNEQNEYYLTDIFELAHSIGFPAGFYLSEDQNQFLNVNTKKDIDYVINLLN